MDQKKQELLTEAGFQVGDTKEFLGLTKAEERLVESHVQNVQQRLAFADFLCRIVEGNVQAIEWNTFVVTHYPDEFLEAIRVRLVRLSIDRGGGKKWSESEIATLQQWARELRSPD